MQRRPDLARTAGFTLVSCCRKIKARYYENAFNLFVNAHTVQMAAARASLAAGSYVDNATPGQVPARVTTAGIGASLTVN